MMALNPALKQTMYFLVVGASAALVHEGVVIGLVEWCEWAPLMANVAGFLVAFNVSFLGHQRLTFNHRGSIKSSLPKFFLTALGAFLLNQLMFAALLRWTTLAYSVALFIVLATVAVITFGASKYWAFRP
jgi:putative flippase GtrA